MFEKMIYFRNRFLWSLHMLKDKYISFVSIGSLKRNLNARLTSYIAFEAGSLVKRVPQLVGMAVVDEKWKGLQWKEKRKIREKRIGSAY